MRPILLNHKAMFTDIFKTAYSPLSSTFPLVSTVQDQLGRLIPLLPLMLLDPTNPKRLVQIQDFSSPLNPNNTARKLLAFAAKVRSKDADLVGSMRRFQATDGARANPGLDEYAQNEATHADEPGQPEVYQGNGPFNNGNAHAAERESHW